jgi:PAS domain S-box-containing protein
MENNICLIAPYNELTELAKQVKQETGLNFSVRAGNLEAGVKQALAAYRAGAQVIISRGGTASSIRKHIDIPVVEIRVTGYDVLRVVSLYLHKKTTIGVIGYESVVRDCRITCDLLNIEIKEIIINNLAGEDVDWMAIQNECQRLVETHGIENIIGDTLIVTKLKFANASVHLLTSGKEALLQAIDEARHIVRVREEERKAAERFKAVINFVHDGVVAVDEHGLITVMNQTAEAVFNLSSNKAVGQPVEKMIRNTHIDKVLKSGRAEIEQLQKVSTGYILTNRVPILVDDKVKGVVATFQEVKKIQDAEQKIRQNLYSKGFVTKYRFTDFITRDQASKQMISVARNYAKANATVLIQGESGTGKEILAQSIHSESHRAGGPFVAINCAALPPQLLESELFGYVEGAFTGAKKGGKLGLFELAHKGTIFLDEVGDIDSCLQGRLLRVLQEKQVMRIGSDTIIPIDVRVIAATNRDLKELVSQGLFRMDLYYRLNVLNLRTIPLRERKQDFLQLVEYFLRELNDEYGRDVQMLPAEIMEWLSNYHWPGNIRELKNVIERIVIQALPDQPLIPITRFMLEDLNLARENFAPTQDDNLLGGTLQDIKRKAILAVLREEEYNKTRASKRLGIDRATIDRLLKTPDLGA